MSRDHHIWPDQPELWEHPITMNIPITGLSLITAERARQIQQEGWSPAHDDTHKLGTLAEAAICYTAAALQQSGFAYPARPELLLDEAIAEFWPWTDFPLKPATALRHLVKAGALITAQIDQILRLETPDLPPLPAPEWLSQPDKEGHWWWLNTSDGDQHPAIIVELLEFGGAEMEFYAPAGQQGWNTPQTVEEMGGLWLAIPEPQLPA